MRSLFVHRISSGRQQLVTPFVVHLLSELIYQRCQCLLAVTGCKFKYSNSVIVPSGPLSVQAAKYSGRIAWLAGALRSCIHLLCSLKLLLMRFQLDMTVAAGMIGNKNENFFLKSTGKSS